MMETLASLTGPETAKRTVIGHQIPVTDRRIDRLVYELYGLTDEEIAVVDGATAS